MHTSDETTSAVTPLQAPAAGLIAVVDDDLSVASALHQWLDILSVPSRIFHHGDTLLQALAPLGEGWGLADTPGAPVLALRAAIIDLNLPGMNGFEVARRLVAKLPTLNVVVITAAHADTQQVFGGPPAGVTCLDKPFTLEQIESVLFGPRAPNESLPP